MTRLLSIQLRARREARGLTQQQAAELFGVDKDTVSRWERGKTRPTGTMLIESLKREYDISQNELDNWFAEWTTEESKATDRYFVRGFEFLAAAGMDEDELLEKLISIDIAVIPRIRTADEGTVSQWAPIFRESPFTWKLLTWGDQIVGYWHFVFLKDEFFQAVKNGALRDSQINESMMEFPSFGESSRTYKMHILMIGVHGAHMHLGPGAKLIRSFAREIERLLQSGIFVSDFVAVAFTHQGVALCQEFGMSRISSHPSAKAGDLAEIFHATGYDISQDGHLSRYPKIASAYSKRFSCIET